MPVDRLLLRMGGESGTDNVISAGDVLTLSVARSGYHVHTFRTYPAEIKGGPVMFQLRVGVRPVPSLGDQLDVLMAFNEEAWRLHREALRRDGVLLYDPAMQGVPEGFQGVAYALPLEELARDLNLRKGKNLIGLGALAAVIHPYPTQAEAIRQTGDMYNRTRLTPFVKKLFARVLSWRR